MVVIEGIRFEVVEKSKGRPKVSLNKTERSLILNFPCVNSHDCTPYSVSLPTGIYRFELWGAQGGYSRYTNKAELNLLSSGKGAYAAGTLKFLTESKLYFYVGGMGENQTSLIQETAKGGFNGGGNGGVDLVDPDSPESSSGGGGSSDIRIIKGDSLSALKSRIIVAAGGAGSPSNSDSGMYKAGDGGTLSGVTRSSYATPGTQNSGLFWKGMDGLSYGTEYFSSGGSTGGSGGGYYGGMTTHAEFNSMSTFNAGGAGGSSYISGYKGCDSVSFDNSDPPVHTNNPTHYTKISFIDPVMMMNGNSSFVDQYGNYESGHFGNGVIKITIIDRFGSVSPLKTCWPKRDTIKYPLFLVLIISY